MATITGQQGAALTQQLSSYLTTNSSNLDTTALTNLINQYLAPVDKLGNVSNVIANGIYKRFGQYDVVSNKVEVVTEGLWSSSSGSLTTFFTGSTTTIAGHSGSAASLYYYNIYLASTATGSADPIEFAVSYGHKKGSGSVQLSTSDSALLPTAATYAQYRIITMKEMLMITLLFIVAQ
jgi:hypothetical protein